MDLYFDYISPYAFLAWKRLHAGGWEHRDVACKPVLFAGLLGAHGNLGPAEVEAKRRYVLSDVARRARRAGLTLALPPTHPFNPLLALRLSWAALQADARPQAVCDALFDAVWSRAIGVETEDQVRRALAGVDVDVDVLLAAAATPAIKARLRATTDEAIARGVFGVPTFAVGDVLFWGEDAMTDLAAHLDGAPEVSPELVAGWEALKPSATRRR